MIKNKNEIRCVVRKKEAPGTVHWELCPQSTPNRAVGKKFLAVNLVFFCFFFFYFEGIFYLGFMVFSGVNKTGLGVNSRSLSVFIKNTEPYLQAAQVVLTKFGCQKRKKTECFLCLGCIRSDKITNLNERTSLLIHRIKGEINNPL